MRIFSLKNKSVILKITWLQLLVISIVFVGCSPKSTYQDYVVDVYQTSHAGDNLKLISADEVKIASEDVESFYAAYRVFILLTRDEQFQYFNRLNKGDLIVFDNRRILHARNSFDLKEGDRHLQGCYVDKDELLSKIRILERELI